MAVGPGVDVPVMDIGLALPGTDSAMSRRRSRHCVVVQCLRATGAIVLLGQSSPHPPRGGSALTGPIVEVGSGT